MRDVFLEKDRMKRYTDLLRLGGFTHKLWLVATLNLLFFLFCYISITPASAQQPTKQAETKHHKNNHHKKSNEHSQKSQQKNIEKKTSHKKNKESVRQEKATRSKSKVVSSDEKRVMQSRLDEPVVIRQPDADHLLAAVYRELGQGNLREADQKLDKLLLAYPNFRLAHLLRGDLLLMRTRPVYGLGAVANAPNDRLLDLRQEAIVRLRAFYEKPEANQLPRSLLYMQPDQRYAFIADTRRSRLYVYQNEKGKPKLIADYYITQGKLGIDKFAEGDQKTPIGVYYITSQLNRTQLPDFYGAGALPINYPNAWDRLHGRSGSGIWLHGTPSGSYSRPPLASDGCVVLANPDIQKLMGSVEIGKTPIVITDKLDFISTEAWQTERALVKRLVEDWQQDMRSLSLNKLLRHYSNSFQPGNNLKKADWVQQQQKLLQSVQGLEFDQKQLTAVRYPGYQDMLMTSFIQTTTTDKVVRTTRRYQYWAREQGQWKIVYETQKP